MTKQLILLPLVLLFSIQLFGQTIAITGHVTAFNRYPVKNVKIESKKAKSSVTTDSLGNFQIVCMKKDRLLFTAKTFLPVTRKVSAKTKSININMVFKEGPKNEEIAIGYGYMNKEDLTYAVSQLSDENNDFSNYLDIYSLIQGTCAGVSVQYSSSGPRIYIRGINSTMTDSYALILVDGNAVEDVSFLSPTQVKSIDILKDSSGSIYGSRGGNGVVLITTKK